MNVNRFENYRPDDNISQFATKLDGPNVFTLDIAVDVIRTGASPLGLFLNDCIDAVTRLRVDTVGLLVQTLDLGT
jgi:hypothetical protein